MTKVVVLRTSQICKVCRKPIEAGQTALQYFNYYNKRTYWHFRHVECQYKKYPRNYSIEEFLKRVASGEKRKEVKKRMLKDPANNGCDVCGKFFKTPEGLAAHRASLNHSHGDKTMTKIEES